MENKFDCEGLLLAIHEIEKKPHRYPPPEDIRRYGFCIVCLGANFPNQKKYPRGGFCCGSWVDCLFPFWGICERFKVDRQRVKNLAKSIRPDGTEGLIAFSVKVEK